MSAKRLITSILSEAGAGSISIMARKAARELDRVYGVKGKKLWGVNLGLLSSPHYSATAESALLSAGVDQVKGAGVIQLYVEPSHESVSIVVTCAACQGYLVPLEYSQSVDVDDEGNEVEDDNPVEGQYAGAPAFSEAELGKFAEYVADKLGHGI